MAEATSKAPARRVAPVLAWAGLAVVAALVALYAARRPIAEQALGGWLRRHGVPGEAQVLAIGPTSVTGRIRIGDPNRPDLTIERVELGYGLRGFGADVRTVTLVRPKLRARVHGGRFSAGALDPLIAEFRRQPPNPRAAPPKIVVQDGEVVLATDAGALTLHGDARVEQGRLVSLAARSDAAHIAGRLGQADLGVGRLTATSAKGRLDARLDAPIVRALAKAARLQDARLQLALSAPYPDPANRATPAPVSARAELAMGQGTWGRHRLDDSLVSATLTGQASGWIADFTLTGRASAGLRAGGGMFADGRAGALRASASAEDLRWTRRGGDRANAVVALQGLADRYVRGPLTVAAVSFTARGPVQLAAGHTTAALAGGVRARGGWGGLGPAAPGEGASITQIRRAVRAFRFEAPGVSVSLRDGAAGATLSAPAQLIADSGGRVTATPRGAGWRLTASGALPAAVADIDRLTPRPGGFDARGRVRTTVAIGPLRGAAVDAGGTLRLANGAATFTGARCAGFDIATADFGAQSARKVKGRLCPAGAPLLTFAGDRWRIAGAARDVALTLPGPQVKLAAASGAVDLSSAGGRLAGGVTAATGMLSDAPPQARFYPLRVAGAAQASRGVWRGSADAKAATGVRLAHVTLRHDVASGAGEAEVETGALRFTPEGLQPAAISPLAAAIGSRAAGEAGFSGRFAWRPAGASSSGVLDVPGLDFQSPAGRVSGLAGRVVFQSLTPLVAAPGQALHATEIATPLGPLRDLSVAFGLDAGALRIADGGAGFGGGRVRIEALELPFTAGGPIRGAVQLDGVELHDLVEASPFGGRVDLKAKVSGRIPFEMQGAKVRITGGDLRAVEPGRLSIQRAALTGVEASGGVATPAAPAAAEPPPGVFTDFAYQAMEDLAFTTLDANVQSRPDGRLGVLFHIVGRHDPPKRQEIRLSLFELISRKFLQRPLPLPSGTGVNLTLDTSLNLDDLLADYAAYRRLHGSAKVQP